MNVEKEKSTEMMIDLNIRPSGVAEQGVVTVNDEVLKHLRLKEADKILLFGKDVELLIGVTGDKLVRPTAISIHEDDIIKLKVKKNGKVGVKACGSIVEKMDELIQRMHAKIDNYDRSIEPGTGR